ncbi:MAG: class I SAM-dependent methyltransferase [Bdellovibrionales bacterium]|nr:class I SAM-dependent methyltransferase [Bdellovibrionales bacterium]
MINENYKDLFSTQSSDYAKFRPMYPKELFDYLASIAEEKNYAWDCGTGNGQAAIELAKSFNHVIATDLSDKQLENAILNPKVIYKKATAEDFSNPEKMDLITVAQAFHWFKHDEFAKTVSRVAHPGSHLAVWTYAVSNITPEIDKAVTSLYSGTLDGYWENERSHVEDGYSKITLPFSELKTPSFNLTAEWDLDHLIGYLSTWSALNTYIKKNGTNPLEKHYPEIKEAWGSVKTRTVTWPLSLRLWRI